MAHHLQHAGCSRPLFGDDALDLLWNASRGLPRLVGTIALAALTRAASEQRTLVEPSILRLALGLAEVSP